MLEKGADVGCLTDDALEEIPDEVREVITLQRALVLSLEVGGKAAPDPAKEVKLLHAGLTADHAQNIQTVKQKISTAKTKFSQDVAKPTEGADGKKKYEKIENYYDNQGDEKSAHKSVIDFIKKSNECLGNAAPSAAAPSTSATAAPSPASKPSAENIKNAHGYVGLALDVTDLAINSNAHLLIDAQKAVDDGENDELERLLKMIEVNQAKVGLSHEAIGEQQQKVGEVIVKNLQEKLPQTSPAGPSAGSLVEGKGRQ